MESRLKKLIMELGLDWDFSGSKMSFLAADDLHSLQRDVLLFDFAGAKRTNEGEILVNMLEKDQADIEQVEAAY